MLSLTVNVHRNILSAQCFIKCDLQNTSINHVKVTCTRTYLSVNFYNGGKLFHDVKIMTPENFFIPSSVLKQTGSGEEIKLEGDSLTISRFCHSHSDTLSKIPNAEKHIDNNSSYSHDTIDNSSSYSHNNIDFIDSNSLHSDDKMDINDRHSSHSYVTDSCSSHLVEINFRVQISSGDLISKCSLQTQSTPSLSDYVKKIIKCPESYEVFCTNCHERLSDKPVYIQQVAECSSRCEMPFDWFCHNHNSNPIELHLCENYLYVGTTSIYLHCEDPVKKGFPHEKSCRNCHAVLAYGNESLSRFSADTVMFVKPGLLPSNNEEYCYKIVLTSLWSIISDKSYACRLLFQCKVGNSTDRSSDPCVLMWVPPMRIAQFKLQSSLAALPTQVDFSIQDTCKVQYYVGSYCSSHVQMWKKEFNVEYFPVGITFINTLKKILISNTESTSSRNDIGEEFSTTCLPFPNL